MKIETTAKLNNLRTSPRKVRLLVDLIRGLKATDALVQLQLSKKDASVSVLKLLKSAIANAKHNHDLAEETLVVKKAFVDAGATLKRWMPKAMGRATPVRKRTSHVTLVLEGEGIDKKAVKKAKKVTKEKKVKIKKETK